MVEPHICAFLHIISCVKNTLCLVVPQVLPLASPSLGKFPRQPQHPWLVWECFKGYSGPYSSGDSTSQGKVCCSAGWNSTVFVLSYVKWTPWALCLLFLRYCLGLEWAWDSTVGCFGEKRQSQVSWDKLYWNGWWILEPEKVLNVGSSVGQFHSF